MKHNEQMKIEYRYGNESGLHKAQSHTITNKALIFILLKILERFEDE